MKRRGGGAGCCTHGCGRQLHLPGGSRSSPVGYYRAGLGPDTQAADDRLVPNSGAKADIARGPESVQQRKWLLVV